MRAIWNPKSPTLLPTIVCYADILGFRNMTMNAFDLDEGEEFLHKIKRSLAEAYEVIRRSATLGEVGFRTLDTQLFDMKVFTDNIVVAYPLRDPSRDLGEPELGALLTLFAHVQASLAADGFFLRGAITVGQHYQDEDIAYGDALLEAVGLDESGGPPRLIIGPSVEPLLSEHISWYYGDWTPYHNQLLEDPTDDRLFVNYLRVAYENLPDGPVDHQLLAAHCKRVRRGLRAYESDSSVLPKYRWSATYHNYVSRAFAERYAVPCGEDAEFWEIAVAEEVHRALEHLVPYEDRFVGVQPRQLDARRLKRRLAKTPR